MGELLGDGLILMAVGMGMVFLFLVILVGAMQALAGFFKKYGHLFPEEKTSEPARKSSGPDMSEVAVAIAAAASRG